MKTLIEITLTYAGELVTAGVALIIRAIEKKFLKRREKIKKDKNP